MASTAYSCSQELKSAAPSFSIKGIIVNEYRIVRRFMIEISWKESSMFWKWFRHYIFPLWREITSSFLVISSWAWHRNLIESPSQVHSVIFLVPIMWARIFIFNQSKSFRLNVVSFAFSFPEAMHWLYIKTFRPAILTNQIDSNLTVLSFHIKYEANLWWLLLTSRCWLVEFIEMKRSCDCLNNIVFCSNRDQQFYQSDR